jgi:hypothetical protein
MWELYQIFSMQTLNGEHFLMHTCLRSIHSGHFISKLWDQSTTEHNHKM